MMEGSNGSSNSPAPFLVKTYEMVDDPYTRSVVSWSHTGQSFVVWNPPEFARDLLPKYFKHNNFSSFIRQLNTYGFRKVDPDQWEFANEEFIRGQRQLLKNIHRRKPIHSHSGQGNAVQLNDSEREEFEREIEKLKQEKFSLQSEIEQHKQENESYAYQLQSLGQTLQSISQRQHELVSNLAQMLYKPTSNITDHSESQNKKRRLLALNYLDNESSLEENSQIINFQENVNLEVVKKLESSLNFWETFFIQTNPNQSGELHNFNSPLLPSQLTVTEMSTSSKESDRSIPPCSPDCNLYVPPLQESHSPPEMSSLCIDSDSGLKCNSTVDINVTATVIPEVQNDGFWQQYLTDTSGAYLTQEVQSRRRDLGYRKESSGVEEIHTHWWNVDMLPQQNGHVTHVERM